MRCFRRVWSCRFTIGPNLLSFNNYSEVPILEGQCWSIILSNPGMDSSLNMHRPKVFFSDTKSFSGKSDRSCKLIFVALTTKHGHFFRNVAMLYSRHNQQTPSLKTEINTKPNKSFASVVEYFR